MSKHKRIGKSWGDTELDRLWRDMCRIETGMGDVDLATDSPKLQQWEAVNKLFLQRMRQVDVDKAQGERP